MSVKNKMWFNENITINETKIRAMDESHGCIIVTEMDENENFLGKDDNGETCSYSFDREWELVPSLLYLADEIETSIQNSYFKREEDGPNYYRKSRAALLKSVIIGERTEDEADEIDIAVERVNMKIQTGDWKSARKRLLETSPSGAFTEEYRLALLADIDAYIEANY